MNFQDVVNVIGDLAIDRGQVTSHGDAGTVRLYDNTKSWKADIFRGCSVFIVHGPGSGQRVSILRNGKDYLEIGYPWRFAISLESVYAILSDSVVDYIMNVFNTYRTEIFVPAAEEVYRIEEKLDTWVKFWFGQIFFKSAIIEEYLNHEVRWFGKLNPQTATKWCVSMDGHLSQPYRAISDNGIYGIDSGDEAQLFGDDDIPIAGMVNGDFNEILIVANSSSSVYLCRIIWGTGKIEDAIAAGQYSEFPFYRAPADNVRKVMVTPMPKVPTFIDGLPVHIWLQCQNATDNATIDFFVGMHGYQEIPQPAV